MLGRLRAAIPEARRLVAHSLSGRLLVLTLVYVLISEVLIFVPQVAVHYREILDNHIRSAELAILPFTEPGGDQLSEGLREQLLKRADSAAVILTRADQRQLFLVDMMPAKVDVTVDLTNRMISTDIVNAFDCLFNGGDRMMHVVSPTRIKGAETIGIVLGEKPVRQALMADTERSIFTSLFISITTAMLVFVSLYLFIVQPMARLTRAIVAFRDNPEDASRIIDSSQRKDEIGIAEREFASMQRDITGFLQQKTRLAALGAAVARIQHDLRNILANAQLASDRLASIDDPVVKRLTPRLVASLDRAVSLATNTLRYGRTEERAPERRHIALKPLLEEAGESAIATVKSETLIAFSNGIDPSLQIDADPEHLYRMILNLVRNAAEALAETGKGGEIAVSAARHGRQVLIDVTDNGPGIPETVRGKLFQPFGASARAGGSGLGLAIARELARAHGGDVTLTATGDAGTQFRIVIPDRRQA
jgi:signal transduction histidine kinase